MTPPPLRSVLFVAGSDVHGLEGALDHGADALIVDLEEPQTPMTAAVRVRARELVASFLEDLPAEHPIRQCNRCTRRNTRFFHEEQVDGEQPYPPRCPDACAAITQLGC